MIELIIKKYLDESFDKPSYLEFPENAPDFFVLIEKTSSGNEDKLVNSTIAFQSYAPSMYESAKLNEEIKKVILEMVQLDEISKVKLNSDYNYTDVTRKRHRYQAVFDIYHY